MTVSPAILIKLTGYRRARNQLAVLHARGFHRAFIARDGSVVLEVAHYEAVCAGKAPDAPVQHLPNKQALLQMGRHA